MSAELADMPLISKCNKTIWFWLYIVDIYSKQAWVAPLKDKKGITVTNAFQKPFGKSKPVWVKSNKIWVDKGSKFYNRSLKPWLQGNGAGIYS